MAPGRLDTARVFARDRWLPGSYVARRTRGLERFLREELAASDFYRPYAGGPLEAIPVVDKHAVLADFAAFNRHQVTLDEALAVAEDAERSRDFRRTLAGADGDGVTVGLSTGTSGTRGVFLVSDAERRLWAGTLMAQLLAPSALRLMLRRPLRVALFLRANSNLYETLDSGRVSFTWHDLTVPLERHLAGLAGTDVLVAPASVLRALAEAQVPGLRPVQVVSVAETLEPDDEAVVARAFGVRVDQIYQATEGLLAVSCPAGRLHLNERYVHVEAEWLDHRRFHPVVTDFTRTTQFVVRHRLDDVLLAAPGPCPCGRPGRTVAAVLGRADDVLELSGAAGPVRVYPDVLRHAVALAGEVDDHRIHQAGQEWRVAVRAARPDDALDRIAEELARLARRLGAEPPRVVAAPWPDEAPDQKRRRIRRLA